MTGPSSVLALPRRAFLGGSAAAAALATIPAQAADAPFSLAYAPNPGSFPSAGPSVLDSIRRAADLGFTAFEDNNAASRTPAEQEAMARLLVSRGMRMGVFVSSMPRWKESRPVLGADDGGDRDMFLADIAASVNVAKRLGARYAVVVAGFEDRRLPRDIQFTRVVDTMRRAADLWEPHGLMLVMENLNTRIDHPGVFLQDIPQTYAVSRAVRSPAVKVLADVYHGQIQTGNLLPTLSACWDEIAYVQFGDTPGRKEPGTGEINYRNVVRWLRGRNYAGIIGMEHGNATPGLAGEAKLVAAYREIDRP